MKNKLFAAIALVLILFTYFGCVSYSEKEFAMLSEKIKNKTPDTDDNSGSSTGSNTGSSADACPRGKWATPTCNGRASLIYYFGPNGEGYSENPECNGYCTPMIFRFRYTISGNKITYNFTSADNVTCYGSTSRPNVPTGTYTITYTCADNGNKLITETSNIQTGARSSATFTRAGGSTSSGSTGSSSGSSSGTTAPAKGQVVVWTNQPEYGWKPTGWKGSGTGGSNVMRVSLMGSSGSIYGGHYSSAPGCGATYCFTKELAPGTYSVSGTVYFLKDVYGNSYPNYSTSQTFTVYANQCTKVLLR